MFVKHCPAATDRRLTGPKAPSKGSHSGPQRLSACLRPTSPCRVGQPSRSPWTRRSGAALLPSPGASGAVRAGHNGRRAPQQLGPLSSAVAGPAHILRFVRLVTAVCGAPEAQVGHIILSACAASAELPGGGHAAATRRCRAPAGQAVYQPSTSPVHGSIPSSDSDTSGDDNSDSHHPSHAAD